MMLGRRPRRSSCPRSSSRRGGSGAGCSWSAGVTGTWELPGGRVDVGETAVDAAVRETAEEAGVRVLITGFAGLFSDPGHVVRSPDGEVRQQFAVLFRARALGGIPHGDLHETSEAAWVALTDLPGLPMEPAARLLIEQAVSVGDPPYLG